MFARSFKKQLANGSFPDTLRVSVSVKTKPNQTKQMIAKSTVSTLSIDSAALAAYEVENPKSLLSKGFSRFEKRFLETLGWNPSETLETKRFDALGTASAKTEKGEAFSFLTGICYLLPEKESGFANLCLWAKNCRALCLNTSGRGAFTSVQKARRRKTFRLCKYGVENFLLNVVLDIRKIAKRAEKQGFGVAIRLDGTSDLGLVNQPIQTLGGKTVAQLFPSVSFYEYSKSFQRMTAFLNREMPDNVHFTFSFDGETNKASAAILSNRGANVAVCFDGSFPTTWNGCEVIDGDVSDLRFLDKKASGSKGYIVALKAKGKAKTLRNGFVVTA